MAKQLFHHHMPWLILLSALLTSVVATGCEIDDPCPGEGEEVSQNLCRRVATDASMPDGGGALGDTCTGDTGCGTDAPYCAKSPFDAEGFCTLRDCTVSPNDCPDGYVCDDSAVQFGAPTYCTAQ